MCFKTSVNSSQKRAQLHLKQNHPERKWQCYIALREKKGKTIQSQSIQMESHEVNDAIRKRICDDVRSSVFICYNIKDKP
jgi:GMP synthase PP-ATPase subunit